MTVTLAIALNAIADVTLIGGLAWLMTRPAKLTPHLPARRLAVAPSRVQPIERHERVAA